MKLALLPALLFFIAAGVGCIDVSDDDDAAPSFPATCSDLKESVLDETGINPANGEYTLYIGGDETRPWTAYCHQMNLATPAEYLTVAEAANFSQVSDGTEVTETTHGRYRIDPVALTLDPLDSSFATTTGENVPLGLTAIPPAFALFDSPNADDGPPAEAGFDLGGTPFALADTVLEDDFFCVVSDSAGSIGSSGFQIASDLASASLIAVNSQADVPTRTVADCDHLSALEAPDLAGAAFPLQYLSE